MSKVVSLSYGVYSLKNFTVNSDGIATVSIDTEGTDYTAGTVNLNVVSSPSDAATATATLDTTNGSVKTITLSNNGSLYQSTPDIVLASALCLWNNCNRNRNTKQLWCCRCYKCISRRSPDIHLQL